MSHGQEGYLAKFRQEIWLLKRASRAAMWPWDAAGKVITRAGRLVAFRLGAMDPRASVVSDDVAVAKRLRACHGEQIVCVDRPDATHKVSPASPLHRPKGWANRPRE